MERITFVRPAYDCIRVKPCSLGSQACTDSVGAHGRGNHGCHNAEIRMTLRGEHGEVTLVINTGWDLPTVNRWLAHSRVYPEGSRVIFHYRYPRFEGDERQEVDPNEMCRDWECCYSDAGYIMAEEGAALLVSKGSDAVWEWLAAKMAEEVSDGRA